MPRRNLALLLAITLVSLLCYQHAERNDGARVLVGAMETIENRALEEVETQELFEGAIEGMLDKLDDEHSAYITPQAIEAFYETLDQEFGGVGMEVGLDRKTNQLMVMSPLVGTPAYKAGIRAGDRILRIAGQSTQGMSLKEAVALMRGKPGDPVALTILHEGEQEPVDMEIVRAKIQVDTVLGDTREADGSWNFTLESHPKIGYVRVTSFTEQTASELRRAIDGLLRGGMEGLILDLRDDPGGLLTTAVKVSDMFIDAGAIVSTRDRHGRIAGTTEQATAAGTYPDFPMVMLVNGSTASASEIVSACLQDHGRAVIVGQRTYGKGTVQEIINLEGDRGALKLTTRSYWRPSERNIHRHRDDPEDADWGVSPDPGHEVALDAEELTRWRVWRRQRDVNQEPEAENGPNGEAPEPFVDRQLQEAIEVVEQLMEQPGGVKP